MTPHDLQWTTRDRMTLRDCRILGIDRSLLSSADLLWMSRRCGDKASIESEGMEGVKYEGQKAKGERAAVPTF